MFKFIIYEEDLTPAEYLAMTDSERSNIISSRIIPPKFGYSGYGLIHVKYRKPKYYGQSGTKSKSLDFEGIFAGF